MQPERRGQRLRTSRGTRIGLWLIAAIVLACVGSLPWTLGPGGTGAGRHKEGWSELARLPPASLGARTSATVLRLDARTHESGPSADEARRLAARARSWWNLLGTDALGRSLLIRLLAGGGVSLVIGIAAAGVSVCIGTIYGAIAGLAGGTIDGVMMRIVDVLYGLPYVLLVVLLAVASDAVMDEHISRHGTRTAWMEREAARGTAPGEVADRAAGRAAIARDPTLKVRLEDEALKRWPPREMSEGTRTVVDLVMLLVAIAGVSWLTVARVVRGQVLSLKTMAFVEAARAVGTGWWGILRRHILPNLVGPVVVYATLAVPQAVLQESFLSFLGIGVRPPMPSLGNLAADGLSELNTVRSSWWLLAFPCLVLAATLLALNVVGEGLRVRLDPRTARGTR
ncbi:MAG: ABC transporter permease [Phycisphaerales bacterium]